MVDTIKIILILVKSCFFSVKSWLTFLWGLQLTWTIKQIWCFVQNCNLIYFQICWWNGWLGQIIRNLIEMVRILIQTSQKKTNHNEWPLSVMWFLRLVIHVWYWLKCFTLMDCLQFWNKLSCLQIKYCCSSTLYSIETFFVEQKMVGSENTSKRYVI